MDFERRYPVGVGGRRGAKRAEYPVNEAPPLMPYPGFPGTQVEAEMWLALRRLNVPFYYKYSFGGVAFLEGAWIVDFYLPAYNVIIDTQALYWAQQDDPMVSTFRRAVMSALGYIVLWWIPEVHGPALTFLKTQPVFQSLHTQGEPLDGGKPQVPPFPKATRTEREIRFQGSRRRRWRQRQRSITAWR